MLNVIAAGAGGFIGATLRYGTSIFFARFSTIPFPWNTLMVNVVGSFFMGIAYEYFFKQGNLGSTAHILLAVGILGGFTTFSSFSLETVNLFTLGKPLIALLNIGGNLALCLFGVALGKQML